MDYRPYSIALLKAFKVFSGWFAKYPPLWPLITIPWCRLFCCSLCENKDSNVFKWLKMEVKFSIFDSLIISSSFSLLVLTEIISAFELASYFVP